MVTKASALWDLAVLHCNKRESGQAPSDSVVLRYGSGQAKGECTGERYSDVEVWSSLQHKLSQTDQTSRCLGNELKTGESGHFVLSSNYNYVCKLSGYISIENIFNISVLVYA